MVKGDIMTEDEKELEERIKQYKYELEDNEEKMKTLYNDTHKTKKKKTLILKMNKTLGALGMLWIIIVVLFLVGLVWFAISNYIGALNNYNLVKTIEDRYDIKLQQISREAEKKLIIYKVKPEKLKFRKVEFSIVMEGTNALSTDIDDQFLKYIIENIKEKELLNGFEIIENYDENGLLEYELKYTANEENASQAVENLQNYVLKYDKTIDRIMDVKSKIHI